jgi:hypothetical protein
MTESTTTISDHYVLCITSQLLIERFIGLLPLDTSFSSETSPFYLPVVTQKLIPKL